MGRNHGKGGSAFFPSLRSYRPSSKPREGAGEKNMWAGGSAESPKRGRGSEGSIRAFVRQCGNSLRSKKRIEGAAQYFCLCSLAVVEFDYKFPAVPPGSKDCFTVFQQSRIFSAARNNPPLSGGKFLRPSAAAGSPGKRLQPKPARSEAVRIPCSRKDVPTEHFPCQTGCSPCPWPGQGACAGPPAPRCRSRWAGTAAVPRH